jgi:putative transposase
MLKNHKLALALSDIGIGEFVRQLTYKCKLYGRELFFAGRFFPSSKMCSSCDKIKTDLTLKDRIFKCECGLVIDRDYNPTLNINKLGRAPTEVTPVEMVALQLKVFPYFVTSVVETGIKQQILV